MKPKIQRKVDRIEIRKYKQKDIYIMLAQLHLKIAKAKFYSWLLGSVGQYIPIFAQVSLSWVSAN